MHSLSSLTFRADLHCHSTCSDGTMSPKELIDLAKTEGLSALSITDHDTLCAYDEELLAYAKEKQILLGVGIEISCHHHKQSVHVLGYDVSITAQTFIAYLKRHALRREHRNRAILDKLQRLGISLELCNLHRLGRPHLAQALLQRGYVRSLQEAFHRYLGDQGCCFVAGELFAVEEALLLIHEAHGKAFLAHPHLYRDRTFISSLLSLPFDGIEAYYARYAPYEQQKWVDLAKQKGLLVSGGSDFHGTIKPELSMGCSFVTKDGFDAIFSCQEQSCRFRQEEQKGSQNA